MSPFMTLLSFFLLLFYYYKAMNQSGTAGINQHSYQRTMIVLAIVYISLISSFLQRDQRTVE